MVKTLPETKKEALLQIKQRGGVYLKYLFYSTFSVVRSNLHNCLFQNRPLLVIKSDFLISKRKFKKSKKSFMKSEFAIAYSI